MASVVRSFLIFLIIFADIGVTALFAQHGGKAEPNEIKFASGKSSKTLSGTLSNDQVMEYSFDARKGQQMTILNTLPSLFDFRVAGNGDIAFDTEFDSSRTSKVELPETGNYVFVVRKKRVKAPRTARFSLNLTIK